MTALRSLAVGTGRFLFGLLLLNIGIDFVSDPNVRERTSSAGVNPVVLAAAEGVLRDIKSLRG